MKKVLLTVIIAFFSIGVVVQAQNVAGHYNEAKNGVAIDGYDPVAYFNKGKAIKGSKKYSVTHNGTTYYFSSERHMQAFKSNPENFEPQYGGWCAYAIGATGEKVEVDPGTFKITDGKLYLFYNKWLTNTLNLWNDDESNLTTKAEENWQGIIK